MDVEELVSQKIENLRPKLLDLSRRNPLIGTRLNARTGAYVRVVDELPDVLLYKLTNGQALRIIGLPDIDVDPSDEQAKAFRDALVNARITDEAYQRAFEKIDHDADDALDQVRLLERELKDRVRSELGMPPRQRAGDVNLVQHAKNHGITPSFELPKAEDERADGRHQDDDVQTLLLPKDLERRLNSIDAKGKSWIQETGLNVLHMAFGFVEWSEPAKTETSFAPLVLLPVKLEKQKTKNGIEFRIATVGEDCESNAVLAEKLRIEFGIVLPQFENLSLESYFGSIQELSPKQMIWKVRRQVALGVFPSARMAMYHDLDTSKPEVKEAEIVRTLLAGSDTEAASPFADEYEVDAPHIEQQVPYIVLDADSSQFSTLVDVAAGKNLAVEGPPGTGKSQTIVNAIAGALASGRKVLFVAEKLAALNVVRSRLESVGLGPYLLTLQAERSTREQVIDSLRKRLDIAAPRGVADHDVKVAEYRKARAEIEDYLAVLRSPFRNTGFTVQSLLNKSIATAAGTDGVPLEVQRKCDPKPEIQSVAGLKRLREVAHELERAHLSMANSSVLWRSTKLEFVDRFIVEDACDLANSTAVALRDLLEIQSELKRSGFTSEKLKPAILAQIGTHLKRAQALEAQVSADFVPRMLEADNLERLQSYLNRARSFWELDAKSRALLVDELSESSVSVLRRIDELCRSAGINSLNIEQLDRTLEEWRDGIEVAKRLLSSLESFIAVVPQASAWTLGELRAARQLVNSVDKEVLSYRTPAVADPSFVAIARKLCREGRELQRQRSHLGERVSLVIDQPVSEWLECLATIRSSGLFSSFTPRYRKAKRLVKALSSGGRFEKPKAIADLEALIEFRRREGEFHRHPQALTVFGVHFSGLETDFDAFDALTVYFEGAQRFNAANGQAILDFLRSADPALLDRLPNLPDGYDDQNYLTLKDALGNWTAQFAALSGAIAELKGHLRVFRSPQTVDCPRLSELVHDATEQLRLRQDLLEDEGVSGLLEDQFAGHLTSPQLLSDACDWAGQAKQHADLLLPILTSGGTAQTARIVEDAIALQNNFEDLLSSVVETAKIEVVAFADGIPRAGLEEALERAANDVDGLFSCATFQSAKAQLEVLGFGPLVVHRLQAENSLEKLGDQVEALTIKSLMKGVHQEFGQKLSRFSGARLDDVRAKIARLDREVIKLARKQLQTKVHTAAKPPRGNGVGRKSEWTEMALIENEIGKQQRFISVRDLTRRAARALLELKPCWMMSPLAVAQYIDKKAIKFDLCIIDEASQMPPEAALGALMRCGQAVVVGDTNQLPPSNFFKSMIDDDDADEDESVLDESILSMANATFRPARRLRWHYRSRHSGLIKFSNNLIYDNNLVVFPSPTEAMATMGVEYRAVKGLYKSGTNAVEARTLVDAALEFMRIDANRSLGIVTLNQKQRDLIREELDQAVAADPRAQDYIERWREHNDGLEEFFVKNLENVQGDERDVIFIGTVYGPETLGGRVAQRFGPINGLAGKRRLNVLFTRAKQKIITFSSMTAADIVADEAGNPGAYMLKRWLEYSASGVIEGGINIGREPDSEFEVYVMDQIRAMGLEPVPQIGVAGYFIDIGVRHPSWSHGFILGVECDGASYHSAKSARDRDRLRQEVLEGLGWKLHRIWSTDWFNNPLKEIEKLRRAVELRLEELKAREAEFTVSKAADAANAELVASSPNISSFAPSREALKAESSIVRSTTSVAIGDTVRVRYLDQGGKTLQVTIDEFASDPDNGIIRADTPVAQALLGAEKDEEVQILVGSYVRNAVIEAVIKRA
jgi:transcription elongation GreA/GreB family factor